LFWGAPEVAVSEKKEVIAIPESFNVVVECEYCKSSIRIVSEHDLDDHEEECIQKLN
jgi:hypothetical protein